MTSLDAAVHSAIAKDAQRADLAIHLAGVSKVYNLYDSPRSQLLDQTGLQKLMFWRDAPKYHAFYALSDIHIDVKRGERLGVIGRNGAGKTTLLKLITGNFHPSTGTVRVDGSVQALMQLGLGIHPEFSGYENIRAALMYNGLVGRQFDEALDEVIDFVELGEFLHQPMKTYSLGMNARVQFAAATAIRPDILIIDEIMGAGDGYFAAKSAHRMQQLTSSGCTLLLVSHSTAQILQFCEDAVWLHEGRIQMRGPALEVVKCYEEFLAELTQREQQARRQAAAITIAAPAAPAVAQEEQRDFVTPAWQQDQLATLLDATVPPVQPSVATEGISRWPGEVGLKIYRVEVFDEHGTACGLVQSGRPMTIEVEVIAEQDGDFRFQIVILIMTLEGVGVVRHLSDPFERKMKRGDRCVVRLSYQKTLLAKGEFVFSAAVFKHYDPNDSSTAVRYDLLSRSFRLKVVPVQLSEPAIFNHPCRWTCAGLSSNE